MKELSHHPSIPAHQLFEILGSWPSAKAYASNKYHYDCVSSNYDNAC